MPEERLVSISSSSHLAPDDVARHTFGSVRRGFDPNEVRAYLESLAVSLRTVAEREQQLLDELADAEHRAANPVLDEATLTAAVGAETARVLHSAHEVAAEMVAKAEAEANRLLTEAREEIHQPRADTEARPGRAVRPPARPPPPSSGSGPNGRSPPASRRPGVRPRSCSTQARDQCRAMVDEAQGLRARVLADLSKRRKVLHAQIEQLRAGRERLAETVQDVRRSIDAIAYDLFAAEDNARLAAEAAGREAAARPDDATPEELASELLAEEAEAGNERAEGEAAAAGGLAAGAELVEADLVVIEEDSDAGPGGPSEVAEESVDALFAKLRAAAPLEPLEPEGTAATAPEPAPEPEPEPDLCIRAVDDRCRSAAGSRRAGEASQDSQGFEGLQDPDQDRPRRTGRSGPGRTGGRGHGGRKRRGRGRRRASRGA